MDRRNQSTLIMVVLIVLMIVLAVVFAFVDYTGGVSMSGDAGRGEKESRDREGGDKGPFPWIVCIPIASGIFIPFMARKQAALKIRGNRSSRSSIAVLLVLVTVLFLASVSYIVLRAY
jgi:hypothetical protein